MQRFPGAGCADNVTTVTPDPVKISSDEMQRFGGGSADNVATVTRDPVIAPEEYEKESSSASLLSSLLLSLYEKSGKQQNVAK